MDQSNNNSSLVTGVIVVLAVAALGWWYFSRPAGSPSETSNTSTQATTTEASTPSNEPPAPVTITYTDQGFSPKSITVVEGQTVRFVNNSSVNMWVASAMHPAHTAYDGTSRTEHCIAGAPKSPDTFDECKGEAPGTAWSFTFNKVGSWNYHDHITSTRFGTVVVSAKGGAGVNVGATTTVNVQ